jgi:hypothetical protein
VSTLTVDGVDLHVGDVLLDPVTGPHLIVDLVEYPGLCFVGDHARVAHGDGWQATVLDHHLYMAEVTP